MTGILSAVNLSAAFTTFHTEIAQLALWRRPLYVHFGSFTRFFFSLLIVTLEQHGFERQRSNLWCRHRIQTFIEVVGPLNQYNNMEVAIFVLSLKHTDLFPLLSLTQQVK